MTKHFKSLSVLLCASAAALSTQAKVTVTTPADGRVAISNGKVAAEFATNGNFDITSLVLSNSGELVKPGDNTKPWAITYKGVEGQVPEMTPEFAEYAGYTVEYPNDTTATISFRWNLLLNYDGNTYPVTMRATVTDNSDLISWNLDARVPEGWTVSKFRFPEIALATPANGEIITPAGWGNLYRLEQNGTYEANYPSWSASMQMIMLNDDRGAFYYSGEDRNACGKLFSVKEKDGALTFSTAVTASEGWIDAETNTFSVPWTTVTGHDAAGWEAAALHWYRPFSFTTEWGSVPLASRNIPDWLRHKDLWMRVKTVEPEAVASADRAIDYFGENIMFHWYWWHHFPYDSHYPDYLPAKPGMKETVKHIQDRNCHITPYINGRLWDPSATSYAGRNGRAASCRNTDGTLYTEVYPTSKVPNTVTCPASPIWHDMLCELADSIQDQLGTNGIYIDQIAAAAPYPCYAANHPHPKGGGEFWYHSYRDIMNDMHRDHIRPGNIVFSEENSECFIPSFDILLTLNTPHNPKCKIVPLYPMIYSDRTQTAGYTYTPGTDVTTGAFRHINMQCFLYGSQLGWIEPRFIWGSDKDGTEAAFLKTLADFRKKQHDVFIGGRYIREIIPGGDNPVTFVPEFGDEHMVKGSEWISPAGKRVIYIVNSDSKAHEVTLPDGKNLKMKPLSVKRLDIK